MGNALQAVGTARLPVTPAYITWGSTPTSPAITGAITFDAILSEEHDKSAVITDHDVETGTNVVDNVRPLPDRLTLEVFVSNSPINSPDANRAPFTIDVPQPGQGSFLAGGTSGLLNSAVQALSGPEGNPADPTSSLMRFLGFSLSLPGQISPLVDQFAGDTDYVAQTFTTLEDLRDTATLLSVTTPHANYDNMLIESIKMHRDASVGTSANMTIEMREVRIISSAIVDAPAPAIPRGNVNVGTGNQSTEDADPASKKSVAAALADGAGGSGSLP